MTYDGISENYNWPFLWTERTTRSIWKSVSPQVLNRHYRCSRVSKMACVEHGPWTRVWTLRNVVNRSCHLADDATLTFISVTCLDSHHRAASCEMRWLKMRCQQVTDHQYDTIRDAILTCARKPTWVSLIYRTEPTNKKCKNRKTKMQKTDMLRNNSKQNGSIEDWKMQWICDERFLILCFISWVIVELKIL